MRPVLGKLTCIHALHSKYLAYIRRLLMQHPTSLFHESFLKKRGFASFLIEVHTSEGFLKSTRVYVCGHILGIGSSLLVSLVFLCLP
jgi:hypothetical protein